ncbi:MFS transporter [Microbispora sp. NPDC049125]|uniref:MFS transporter n=1 Tax=Microbispora sp. NPDC049125 TaxID=3154929 RepID=UPI00346523A7
MSGLARRPAELSSARGMTRRSPAPPSGRGLTRRYALIEFLTWLPPGLMMAPYVLLMTVRGLDLAQIGVVGAAYSVTIVVLELPTGGLADVVGRRGVLAAAAAFSAVGLATLALAGSFWPFFAAAVLKGIARALSSGPAQAWYVDALHAEQGSDADLKPGLAAGGAAGAIALTLGILAGGAVPLLGLRDALAVPVWTGAGAAVVLLVAALAIMHEPVRPHRARVGQVVRDVPRTIAGGVRLALVDRGLARLLLVAAAGGLLLTTIETLTPGRLAALTGLPETGSTAYALVAAAGFAANAAGSSLTPAVARLAGGSVRAAVLATVAVAVATGALAASVTLHGWVAIAAMGAAYAVLFAALSVAMLLRDELMHKRVAADRRATVMSVDSLQLQFGALPASLCLVPLAGALGVGAAWAVVSVIVLASALLFVRLPERPAASLVEHHSVRGHNQAGTASQEG